jgi:hypothetical protein
MIIRPVKKQQSVGAALAAARNDKTSPLFMISGQGQPCPYRIVDENENNQW